MNLHLAGYEMLPMEELWRAVSVSGQGSAEESQRCRVPMPVRPIYTSDRGDHFIPLPSDDGVSVLPFIPGSPAVGDLGGFVPIDRMAKSSGGDGSGELFRGMASALPAEQVADWLGAAALNGMLGGAPGTGLNAAMQALGMANPMASGALGGAVAAAGNAAGLGQAAGLLGGALAGGPAGLANALGAQGLARLAGAAGLGNIPGLNAVAGIAGGQMSQLAGMLAGGGWSGALDQASGALGDALSGDAAGMANNIVAGGCTNPTGQGAGGGLPDPAAIGAQALDQAADHLLSQWQVDDESSAAEHIAHKAVNDNKAALKQAATDPESFSKKIKQLFSGASSDAVLPAARLTDPDLTKPEVVARGVATILAEGLPISRMTDPIAPSQALILEGSSTVLSAGLPTARVTSKTDSPGVMIEKGAPTVLVGGKGASISPPAPPPDPDAPANAGPAGPEAPQAPDSGSGSTASDGEGGAPDGQAGGATRGKPGEVVEEDGHKGYADIMHLPVKQDGHDPHAPLAEEPFRYVCPQTDEWRAWDPARGMSATPSETPGLTLPDWGLFVAGENERGWFGNEYTPGNWYLLGGLIDLGSPIWPGAGSGGAWYIPDSILGRDMSSYYIPHDWMYHPGGHPNHPKPSFGDIFTEWEIPSFIAGLSFDPLQNVLQVVYSGATTLISIGEWTAAKVGSKLGS
jgi:hypothetical protein